MGERAPLCPPVPEPLRRRGLRTFSDGLPEGARVAVDVKAFARVFGAEMAGLDKEGEASCAATE